MNWEEFVDYVVSMSCQKFDDNTVVLHVNYKDSIIFEKTGEVYAWNKEACSDCAKTSLASFPLTYEQMKRLLNVLILLENEYEEIN